FFVSLTSFMSFVAVMRHLIFTLFPYTPLFRSGCCHLQIKGFFSVCRYAQIHSEVMILSAWRTRPAPLTITSAERRAAKRNDIYFYAGFIPSITKLDFKVPSGMSKLVSVKSHVSI